MNEPGQAEPNIAVRLLRYYMLGCNAKGQF